jgi:hypothetical protein
MALIKVNLVDDLASLVTVEKKGNVLVLPPVVEPDITDAIAAFTALHPSVFEFYFATDSSVDVIEITLQHTTVSGNDPEYYSVCVSDKMSDSAEQPSSDLINYLEALALL